MSPAGKASLRSSKSGTSTSRVGTSYVDKKTENADLQPEKPCPSPNYEMDCFQWIGFAVSIVAVMFCGISLSFNVIALKLKTSFRLDQWQVENLASSLVMGWSFALVNAWIIKRFGNRVCYIMVLLITISTNLLMWLSTQYALFFRQRTWLMCAFFFCNTAGTGSGLQCIIAIGIQVFAKKHTGKVIGVYMASFGFAKIYYSFLFDIYFQQQETLAAFFLTQTVTLGCSLLFSYFFHRVPCRDEAMSDTTSLIDPSDRKDISDQNSLNRSGEKHTNDGKSQLQILLTSSYFYFQVLSFGIFQASNLTFMNNVTSFAASVGAHNDQHFVYILAVILVSSRMILGVIYDYFGSFRCGMILMFAQYVLFCAAMIVAIFWLDGKTIYVIVVLASVGCGAGSTILPAMMTSDFGQSSYANITGLSEALLAPAILIVHMIAGYTYENTAHHIETTELFCKECFNDTFIMLLGLTIFVIILQAVNSFMYVKNHRTNNNVKTGT